MIKAAPDYCLISQVLIANGANVNAENENGERPLENAAKRDHADIAKVSASPPALSAEKL